MPQHTTLTNGNNNVQMAADDTDSSEIHVIAVQNDVDLNGHTVDVAHVSVGDEHIALVDVTQNGEVDIMMGDSNHDGQIDDNELHDISDSHMPCSSRVQRSPVAVHCTLIMAWCRLM
jgi:hypothetical protein